MSEHDAEPVACGGTVPATPSRDRPRFAAPEPVVESGRDYLATLETSCGPMAVELFADEAPETVNSFVFLAGEGFFDATVVHRVVPGFVVQMGDPTGTGTGGPGYRIDDELGAARGRGYRRGTVAMANAGPDTNGSQFFVCLDDVALPPAYTVFGDVVDGMDAADRIASVPCRGETPVETVFLERVTVQPG